MAKGYAVYLRKSRADIELEKVEKFETLAMHEKALKDLAKKQGLRIAKTYREIVSGESIDARPQMQQLLNDVMQSKYKGVLVMEIERLARGNTKEQGIVAEAFQFSSTKIITPIKTYDPNNEFDEEYFEFGLFMSRREYKTIRRRMQRGLIEYVKAGNYVGSIAPYGYDKVHPDKQTKTLKPNDEAPIVKMIFDWFVNDGMTTGAIARKLTEMGIKTRTGLSEWNRNTIKDILKNDIYIGKIRWFRRKVAKEFDGETMKKTKRRQLQEDYILVPGKHPALISEEMFAKAQKLLPNGSPVNANKRSVSAVAGLIFCKKCGRRFYHQSFYGKQKENTRPRITHDETKECKMKSIPADEFMDALIKTLNGFIDDFKFKLENDNQDINIDHEVLIKSLEKDLKEREAQKKNAFIMMEKNLYTEDEFMERKIELTEEINQIKKSIEETKKSQPVKVDYEEKIIKFSEVVESLKDDNVDARQKNIMLKEIIERIEMETKDLGRQKGATFTLDVFLKS